jgi:hypothetical protein
LTRSSSSIKSAITTVSKREGEKGGGRKRGGEGGRREGRKKGGEGGGREGRRGGGREEEGRGEGDRERHTKSFSVLIPPIIPIHHFIKILIAFHALLQWFPKSEVVRQIVSGDPARRTF